MVRASNLLVALSCALAALGCTTIQESLACPGDRCPAAMAEVRDEVAALPGVTGTARVWRDTGLDDGVSGGVDVRAEVADGAAARALAERIAAVFRASDIEPVRDLFVLVLPAVPRSRPAVSRVREPGDLARGARAACAAARCATELAAFERAFAASPLAGGSALDRVAWTPRDGTRIEVRVGAVATGAQMSEFGARLEDLATSSGLRALGDFTTVLHYDEPVRYSFRAAGKGGGPVRPFPISEGVP